MRRFRSVSELPESGLVLEGSFLSSSDDHGLLPLSRSTWNRGLKSNQFPQPVKLVGRNAYHAEHIRAIALGRDWRDVKLPD